MKVAIPRPNIIAITLPVRVTLITTTGEIVEIINVTPEGIGITNTPFVWNPSDDQFYFKKNSKIFEKIAKRNGMRIEELELEFRRRVQLIYKLHQNKIFKFEEVQKIVNEYYKKPEAAMYCCPVHTKIIKRPANRISQTAG